MLPKFVPGGKNRGDAACMYVWSTRKQAHNVAGQEGWVYEPHLRCHNGMADHMKNIRQKAAAPQPQKDGGAGVGSSGGEVVGLDQSDLDQIAARLNINPEDLQNMGNSVDKDMPTPG